MSSTAVIAFVFIPFVAIGGMALGIFVGWLVSLLPLLRKSDKV
jgi:NhaP-type Na+/H+ or K+/H+ antiporter